MFKPPFLAVGEANMFNGGDVRYYPDLAGKSPHETEVLRENQSNIPYLNVKIINKNWESSGKPCLIARGYTD